MNATATIAPAGPQYMRALERANQVRLARASLKRRIALGEVCVAAVVLDCPWEANSMAVADLLISQRRWGQTRCRKFLAQLAMSEKKTVGSMTDRQRRTLAAMLTTVPSGCDEAEAQAPLHDDREAKLDTRPFEGISAHRAAPREHRAMALTH
ncbi:MAG TPA: hypothetical protein VGL54_01665 [Solirubrobacteraceae bacterium]|jgi:hypothetical protein